MLKVCEESIKITLIQTVPGKEFFVAKALEDACLHLRTEITDYCVLKCLGPFDIVLIYSSSDFGAKLTKFGPIDGVLRTTRFFCFEYSPDDQLDKKTKIIQIIKENPFTSISFIRKPKNTDNPVQMENNLLNRIKDGANDGIERNVLGTLGWSEIVFLASGKSINKVIKETLWLANSEINFGAKKTYSLITIGYDQLPEKKIIELGRDAIKKYLKDITNIKENVDKKISVSLKITSSPESTKEIVDFIKNDTKIDCLHIIGKEDIYLDLSKKNKWESIFAEILLLRNKFKEKILSTNTVINVKFEQTGKDNNLEDINPTYKHDYSYQKLKLIFENQAIQLAYVFNTLNGLFQNKIIGDAYDDMEKYPNFIEWWPNSQCFPKDQKIIFASEVITNIKNGAALRTYGTHGTIDEISGSFARLRGGAHVSLGAISFFPNYMYKKHSIGKANWEGFVASDHPFFSTMHMVLNVPPKALWRPEMWWALFHEIGHMFVKYIPDFICEEQEDLKIFLAQKGDAIPWLDFVEELAVEFFGYKMAFFEDYDLFVKKLWRYIEEIHKKNYLYSSPHNYAVRTFFMKLYSDTFEKGIGIENCKREFEDTESIYWGIVEHIEDLYENILLDKGSPLAQDLYNKRYFTAAYHSGTFKDLFPWISNAFTLILNNFDFKKDKMELSASDTNIVVSGILRGEPWVKDIRFPIAVLNKIFSQDKLSFKASIATVLTFSNLNNRLKVNKNEK